MKKIIQNNPPKGTVDWLPEEFEIRKYIFDTWRRVCVRFGYQEYLTPLVEYAELYRAKSGEDIGEKELMFFTDRAGRELSIRPEMTPSVTRLVSKIYNSSPKPLRFFSIANFMRNEKPQRGRNREFWQLNFDLFGMDSPAANIEVAQIALDIMLEFNPPKNSFVFYINNRKIIDYILDQEVQVERQSKLALVRILDKWEKLPPKEFEKKLAQLDLNSEQIKKITSFMESKNSADLQNNFPNIIDNSGLKEVKETMLSLEKLGYQDWIEFKPNIIRGFDYYDGIIYEVFDKNPKNTRAMFGGGRYNGLAEIFGIKKIPSIGFAPGDETIRLFLESWGLLDQIKEKIKKEIYYLPILDIDLILETQLLAQKLRQENKNIEIGLEVQKINKALSYANKKEIKKTIIFGKEEAQKNIYKIKNMQTGKEEKVQL